MNFSKYEIVSMIAIFILFVVTVMVTQTQVNISNFASLTNLDSQQASIGVLSREFVDGSGNIDFEGIHDRENITELIVDDIERGGGSAVKEGDIVNVHYIGRLSDGTQFDSSRDRGQQFRFQVGAGRVITGWEQGILGMREGGTRMLVIPSEMGYGNQSVGNIPPNSTLIFVIELLSIE